MQNLSYFVAFLLSLILLLSGCTDPSMPSDPATSATQPSLNSGGDSGDIVKIAVLANGTVVVNSEAVSIDSLASKIDSIGTIKEIWYYREDPDTAEPHENAMITIEEIANRKLPIAMFLDRAFTHRMSFDE